VLVFMNGKNNLESYGLADLNEMETAGSTDKVNIVAELGRSKANDTSDGDWKGARRFLVQKDADPDKVTSPVLAELPDADMGDWRHLADFIAWGKDRFPARHYMLIVWDHGDGWKGRAPAARGISTDDETGHSISTGQLGLALERTGRLDLFGMDACIMQMAEVAWTARNTADYILASEEVVPNEGQRYDLFFAGLAGNPALTAEELGRHAVKVYADHYEALKRSGTMSLIRAEALPKFAALLDEWTDTVILKQERMAVHESRGRVQQFWYDDNIDIYHLIQLTNKAPYLSKTVAEKGAALLGLMDKELVVSNRRIGGQYANAHGLAIYMPKEWQDPAYNSLDWAAATKWEKFCAWMLGKFLSPSNSPYRKATPP
jgi:hypothetical protein